jgi:hypothetical protein
VEKARPGRSWLARFKGCLHSYESQKKEKKTKEKMVLQGLIWNYRGLKKGVSTFLKKLILEFKYDFVGL